MDINQCRCVAHSAPSPSSASSASSKARIIDDETLNLTDEHTAAVEGQVLAKARQQTPGQARVATRQRHHQVKQFPGWSVTQHGSGVGTGPPALH